MTEDEIDAFVLSCTAADAVRRTQPLQSLWSGYGSIVRYWLDGGRHPTVIVKHVCPGDGGHPRGWNTNRSHQRKLDSYQVEANWYRTFSMQCDDACRIPVCFGERNGDDQILLVLEDLDAKGYPARRSSVSSREWRACVRWLAAFHARFLGQTPDGLWSSGTYWHLETRPDELNVLEDLPLKQAAGAIDQKLKDSTYQTLVHGDAKLANFCFSEDGSSVAAVDFQYIGGGCGMKDLAYFAGSCFRDAECEHKEAEILDTYFEAFRSDECCRLSSRDAEALESEWRGLYRVAWADFHRFMKGWSPGHWKLSDYSERITREVIAQLAKDVL